MTTHSVQSSLVAELDTLVSEGRNPDTRDIDTLSTEALMTRINEEDHNIAPAIAKAIPAIAQAVEHIVTAFANGGRLLYMGAGTSGRLGILDAVECPPTFSVPPEQVQGIIAGGEPAIYKAVEGAEDDPELGVSDLKERQVSVNDVVVGLAASGRTPYVLGAMDYARSMGAHTVGITCNPGTPLLTRVDTPICLQVGPEVLTGSTRMKSGTAQKLVLNMLTTGAMIRSGKSYENLMVDVSASNKKLYARAIRIVMQATECDEETARQALADNEYQAKLAILSILTGVDKATGKQLLQQQQGFLRRAVNTQQES